MNLLKLTIFLGSFISFALEPLIGRTLLPEFGGTAAVWVTCLAAFQVLMVGGYFYAAKMTNLRLHLAFLALSAVGCAIVGTCRGFFLPVLGNLTSVPACDVFLAVLALCGVAFVVLSANSTIVQRLSGGDYRLYAWSNVGSMAGLFAYPFVLEPAVSLTAQWVGVGVAMVVYGALLCLASRGGAGTHETHGTDGTHETHGRERLARGGWLWLVLPGASCFLLNALTTHLTLDVMPMPLVWTLTLAIFLLSYVIGFSGKSEKLNKAWVAGSLVFGLVLCCLKYEPVFRAVKFPQVLAVVCCFLLFACTALHTWLYETRPGGVLCVNISNYHLDLKPFMKAVGDAFELPLLGFSCANDYGQLQFGTDAAFFCRDPGHLSNPPQGVRLIDFTQVKPMSALPTDDKGSFISLIRW